MLIGPATNWASPFCDPWSARLKDIGIHTPERLISTYILAVSLDSNSSPDSPVVRGASRIPVHSPSLNGDPLISPVFCTGIINCFMFCRSPPRNPSSASRAATRVSNEPLSGSIERMISCLNGDCKKCVSSASMVLSAARDGCFSIGMAPVNTSIRPIPVNLVRGVLVNDFRPDKISKMDITVPPIYTAFS